MTLPSGSAGRSVFSRRDQVDSGLVGPLDQVRTMFDLADDSVRTPEHNGVKLVDPAGIVFPVAYPLQRAHTRCDS
jgi:hypothetical protein